MATAHIGSRLDHLAVCDGHIRCKKCGRRGCLGCIHQPDTDWPKEKVGLCVVCSGIYKEERIILYPRTDMNWDL